MRNCCHGCRLATYYWLRVFAAECADRDEGADPVTQARTRVLDWYAHTAARACDLVFPGILHVPRTLDPSLHPPVELADQTKALGWLDAERVNLFIVIHQAAKLGFPKFAMHLVDAIQVFLVTRAHWEELCDIHVVAVAAAQGLGDRVCEGWFEFYHGWFHLQMSLHDDACEPLRRALAIARELGDDLMYAWTLTAFGRGSQQQRRYAEALDYLDPALAQPGHGQQTPGGHRAATPRSSL